MIPLQNLEKLSEYSQKQLDRALTNITLNLTEDLIPVLSPKAFLLGGQPGAGKTTLHNIIKTDAQSCIIINGDEFRIYHPHFNEIDAAFGADSSKHTHKFAGAMTEWLIDRLSDKGYNLIIEGTLRTSDTPLKTCELLKSRGYTVELSVMAVDKTVSWQSTLDRYEAMKCEGKVPRATPKEHHDKVVKALPGNLNKIYNSGKFDRITIYERTGKCIYDSVKNSYNPQYLLHYKLNNLSYEMHPTEPRPLTILEQSYHNAKLKGEQLKFLRAEQQIMPSDQLKINKNTKPKR